MKPHEPKWVDDPKNSLASSIRLDKLDFSQWWTDSLSNNWPLYLHVPAKPSSEWADTIHRVYPRKRKGYTVRLGCKNGRPYWIYDREHKYDEHKKGA